MSVWGVGEATPRGVSQRTQHPQRDTASRTQARTGSLRGTYPSGWSTPQRDTASRTQARTGRPPRGVSQCAPHPPAGYYELDAGKDGEATPRGVSQRVKHPQRDTTSWTQARTGRPPRDVSQRVLLDVHFRGRVLGLQNGVVRVLCITR